MDVYARYADFISQNKFFQLSSTLATDESIIYFCVLYLPFSHRMPTDVPLPQLNASSYLTMHLFIFIFLCIPLPMHFMNNDGNRSENAVLTNKLMLALILANAEINSLYRRLFGNVHCLDSLKNNDQNPELSLFQSQRDTGSGNQPDIQHEMVPDSVSNPYCRRRDHCHLPEHEEHGDSC